MTSIHVIVGEVKDIYFSLVDACMYPGSTAHLSHWGWEGTRVNIVPRTASEMNYEPNKWAEIGGPDARSVQNFGEDSVLHRGSL